MPVTVTELGHIWSKVLSNVKEKIPDNKIFDAFLGDSFLYSYNNDEMIVGVNSNLASKILSDQYSDLIEGSAREIVNRKVKISFKVVEKLKDIKVEQPKTEFFKNSIVNTSLTFDNFIVGKCNIEAQQAAIYIASNPGKNFNPLFIYSNSGLGKTHLLHAIVNHIHNNSDKRALYLTSDDFTSEFIKSFSTLPGPTDANWSTSPTKISFVPWYMQFNK